VTRTLPRESPRQWLTATAGGLPREFWVLWWGTLINRLGSFVIIFLAFYLTAGRGFSASFAGLAIGLAGAGGALGVLLGGVLADRWGRRPTLFLAHIGTAVSLVALGLARSAPAIIAFSVLFGVLGNLLRPAFSAMMIDVVPPGDRHRAFSLNYWAINLGFAVAAALAGALAQINYLWLFVLDAATALIAGIAIFALVPESRPSTVDRPTDGRAQGLGTVLRDPVFMAFSGLAFLTATVFLQHTSSLPIAMARDGLAPGVFGVVIALNGVLIVAGQLFLSRPAARVDATHMMAIAAVVIGAGFGFTAWAHTAWMYGVAVVIWTIGEMIQMPSVATLLAELSPAHLRGRYQGVFQLSWGVAGFLAPVLGGWVLQHRGGTPLWAGCFLIGLVVAGGHLATGSARRRRVDALAAHSS
jgi:MFS family permease